MEKVENTTKKVTAKERNEAGISRNLENLSIQIPQILLEDSKPLSKAQEVSPADNLPEKEMEPKWKIEETENNKGENSGKKTKRKKRKLKKISTGKWTEEEHQRFLEGIHKFGNLWNKVSSFVGTRSHEQTRSHSQKFFAKLRQKEIKRIKNSPAESYKIFAVTREYLNRVAFPANLLEYSNGSNKKWRLVSESPEIEGRLTINQEGPHSIIQEKCFQKPLPKLPLLLPSISKTVKAAPNQIVVQEFLPHLFPTTMGQYFTSSGNTIGEWRQDPYFNNNMSAPTSQPSRCTRLVPDYYHPH